MNLIYKSIVLISILKFSFAYSQCVSLPNSNDRAQWLDVESFKASNNLNNDIGWVQNLNRNGHGELNYDVYSVTIDADGQTPESLFSWFRSNLDQSLFSGTYYSLRSYDDVNAEKWKSDAPEGALMSFTLAAVGIIPLEKGSVVLSCFSSTDFIFSTVYTENDELHPVAGNRAFGVRKGASGGLTIFVKAADRIVNSDRFGLLPKAGRELIFEQGHDVWMGMLSRLKVKFADRNPRDDFVFSVRVPY
jgi:hypothetical protein